MTARFFAHAQLVQQHQRERQELKRLQIHEAHQRFEATRAVLSSLLQRRNQLIQWGSRVRDAQEEAEHAHLDAETALSLSADATGQ